MSMIFGFSAKKWCKIKYYKLDFEDSSGQCNLLLFLLIFIFLWGIFIDFWNSRSSVLLGTVFEVPVILSLILLPSKLPVASVVFCIALFEVVLSASVTDYLA